MSRRLTCPHCGTADVLRAPCHRTWERLLALLGMAPFHCQHCSHRFMAFRLGRVYPTQRLDRRKYLRIPVRLFLSFSGGRIKGEGTVKELSMGGCIIESAAPVHVDDIFYLQIALEEGAPPLEVAGMVRSVTSRGIAFKFLRSAQENKRLRAFVQSRVSPRWQQPTSPSIYRRQGLGWAFPGRRLWMVVDQPLVLGEIVGLN